MRAETRAMPCLSEFVEGMAVTPDVVTRLAALAIMQAHIVTNELYDIVIPLLPPTKRTFALSIARRLEHGTMLEDNALRDLETFGDILVQLVEAGTHTYWHGDDNHVRGGYECVHRSAEARQLSKMAAELGLLADIVLATLSAARAVRQTQELISR